MKHTKFYLFTILTSALLFSCQDKSDLVVPAKHETSDLKSDITITTVPDAIKEKAGARVTNASYVYTLYKGSFGFTPEAICVDQTNMITYIADRLHHCVYKLNGYTGQLTLLVGQSKQPGYGNGAGVDPNVKLNGPSGLAIDPQGKFLYISDTYNHRIRKYDIANDMVSTIIGSLAGNTDGVGYAAKLNRPVGITITPTGKYLYVADGQNASIRRYDINNDMLYTVCYTQAWPSDIAYVGYNPYDNYGTVLFTTKPGWYTPVWSTEVNISEPPYNVPSNDYLINLGGSVGIASSKESPEEWFYTQNYIQNDAYGHIYSVQCGVGTTTAWSGIVNGFGYKDDQLGIALFKNPTDLTVSNSSIIYVSDTGNNAIRFILP